MITIKTEEEIKKIEKACKIVAKVLDNLAQAIAPGVTTEELDRLAEDMILASGARPAFKGYRGYKHATCLSVNNEVVHGIPSGRKLSSGDVIGVDVGAVVDGYYGDAAKTFPVGSVSRRQKKLLSTARECLKRCIAKAHAGSHIGDIGEAIQSHAEAKGFSVVRDLFGHGIGKSLHEDPLIPNFGRAGEGLKIKQGMVLAVETMINEGGPEIGTLPDGWTVVTRDGGLSAHFEHTIAVTAGQAEILTIV
jgi:methionyl aminopeptidase